MPSGYRLIIIDKVKRQWFCFCLSIQYGTLALCRNQFYMGRHHKIGKT